MIARNGVIHKVELPQTGSFESLSDLPPELLHAFRILAEADADLLDEGDLSELSVQLKLEAIYDGGELFVERDSTGFCVRGALHGSMNFELKKYDVELVAVEKAFRRRGIGKELLHCAEVSARNLGAKVMTLNALDKPGIDEFYEEQGYHKKEIAFPGLIPMIKKL